MCSFRSTKLFCEQDSHPSPAGCQLIAEEIFKAIQGDVTPMSGYSVGSPKDEKITGDLAEGYKLAAETVAAAPAGNPAQVEPNDAKSPVVVIGDSHTLIFSTGGDMLLKSAGVVDHLQAKLGFPVFLSANRGSGVDAARATVARTAFKDKTFWDGKKVVVWCIGARMLTQERQWREVPAGPPQ